MSANKSMLEYLSTSSQEALEAFRISRLDRASRLRAKISELYEQWVQAQVEACIAEWVLDRRGTGDPTPCPKTSARAEVSSSPEARIDERAPLLRQLTPGRENRLSGQLTLKFGVSQAWELEPALADAAATGAIALALDPAESEAFLACELPSTAARARPTLLMFPDPDIDVGGANSAKGRRTYSTPLPRFTPASATSILRHSRGAS